MQLEEPAEAAARLQAGDLRVGAGYERVRMGARAEAIELRRRRRIRLGDLLTLVFENRETLRAAAEEGLRAERAEEPAAVAAEASRFQALLPPAGGLAASLYLELADPAELAGLAGDLEGIATAVRLEVAGEESGAQVTSSQVTAPAAYLHFSLSAAQRESWLEGAPVRLSVSHPRYSAATDLSDEQRAALALDLRQGGSSG